MLRSEWFPSVLWCLALVQGDIGWVKTAWHNECKIKLQVWWLIWTASWGPNLHRLGIWHLDQDWWLARKFLQVPLCERSGESHSHSTQRPWLPEHSIGRTQPILWQGWQLPSGTHEWWRHCITCISWMRCRRIQWRTNNEPTHAHN